MTTASSPSQDWPETTPVTVANTYTAATTSAIHYIGRWVAGSFPGTWAGVAWLQAFNADLSDADLDALSAAPSTYVPPAISTAPVFSWQSRWYDDGQPVVNPVGSQAGRLVGTAPSSIVKTLR